MTLFYDISSLDSLRSLVTALMSLLPQSAFLDSHSLFPCFWPLVTFPLVPDTSATALPTQSGWINEQSHNAPLTPGRHWLALGVERTMRRASAFGRVIHKTLSCMCTNELLYRPSETLNFGPDPGHFLTEFRWLQSFAEFCHVAVRLGWNSFRLKSSSDFSFGPQSSSDRILMLQFDSDGFVRPHSDSVGVLSGCLWVQLELY